MKAFIGGIILALVLVGLWAWLAPMIGLHWLAWLLAVLVLVAFGVLVWWFWQYRPEDDPTGGAMTSGLRRFLVFYLLAFCLLMITAITVLFSFNFLIDSNGKSLLAADPTSIPRPGQFGYLNTWWNQKWALTPDMQFLLLAICSGALGSSIHAVKSLADFLGNRADKVSWFWFYITRPFLGSSLALIFYTVLRGGLMTGAQAAAAAVNPFGIVALCGLAGMFADRASQKLGEIFDTLFKTEDARKDKLEAPQLISVDPATIPVNSPKLDVTVRGVGLGKTNKVRVNGTDRTPTSVTDSTVIFTLTQTEVAARGRFKIQLVTAGGALSRELILNVSDIAITTASPLPSGTVGQQYGPFSLQASGGTGANTWAISDLPQGLALDADTGQVSGTPAQTTGGARSIKITVTDRDGAAATISATLTIN